MTLKYNADAVKQRGHAIECRINAEDPENNFFPDTGDILLWFEQQQRTVRYDSGVASGSKVDVFYDSMIAKVITHAATRAEAIQRMLLALDKTIILGVTTNRDFLKELLTNPAFVDGSFDTKLIEREYTNYKKAPNQKALHASAIASLLHDWWERREQEPFAHSLNGWRNIFYQPHFYELDYGSTNLKIEYTYRQQNKFEVTIEGQSYVVEFVHHAKFQLIAIINDHRQTFFVARRDHQVYVQHPSAGNYRFKEVPRFPEPGATNIKGAYIAPMPGEIIKVLVKAGDKVQAGKGLLVMSSMKMETTIEAHTDGEIEEVFVTDKLFVEADTLLLKMKEE
jgi:acetyl/propionyl-CoA carboxylase alpha subunit